MQRTQPSPAKAFTLAAAGLAAAAMGLYGASVDGAPGAPIAGMLLMSGGLALGLRAARHRLAAWAARSILAIGILTAATLAFWAHARLLTAPLFAHPGAVISSTLGAPLQGDAVPIERARATVRYAVWSQHLPGVSVAVGRDGGVVWAEGFGWRDVMTRTPVTPSTRFNIGTAASVVLPEVTRLGLTASGSDAATVWSPEHIGEPEEDFPGFRALRDVVFKPLGLMASDPLPGERATFYVPQSNDDPTHGRRQMAMRDLACCDDGRAFSSTPSDLVRVAMTTSAGDVEGRLAGGLVTSIVRGSDGVVLAVSANIAHADTTAIARVALEAFAAGTAR